VTAAERLATERGGTLLGDGVLLGEGVSFAGLLVVSRGTSIGDGCANIAIMPFSGKLPVLAPTPAFGVWGHL